MKMVVVVVRAMEGSGGHFGFGVDCGLWSSFLGSIVNEF